MAYAAYIAAPLALIAAALLAGWWRLAFRFVGIRPSQMTVERLGLLVSPEHQPRIDAVLSAFAGGFNAMIALPSASGWERYCARLPTLCQPFAHEGASMGYTLRRLFRFDPADFERRTVSRHPQFRYLYYVGLGFWSGMRNHDGQRLARVVAGLDPLHGALCYDGYGFKHGFFDYPKDPAALRRLDSLDGYARSVAYQGVGRSLFFYYMREPDVLIEHIDRLGGHAPDAASGAGLAAVFIFHDRLDIALEAAGRLPAAWQSDVHLGMCFGLKARSINDPARFERDVDTLPPAGAAAARAAIRECDRVEAEVRADGAADGYRRWREAVRQWMADNIEYPLAGFKSSTGSEALCGQVAAS
jgi:hypothetical protein